MAVVSSFEQLEPTGVSLPEMFNREGRLILRPDAFFDTLAPTALRIWAHQNGRYGVPTAELVGWLRWIIGNRFAIEIGAGSGDLSLHLGTLATDSYMQSDPAMQAVYEMMGQPTIRYGRWVEKLSALDAAAKYKPDVVVASWVTQLYKGDGSVGACAHGVDEDELLDTGVTYILIGNQNVHGDKRIMKRPHVEHKLPFLRSRAKEPEKDRVWIWG